MLPFYKIYSVNHIIILIYFVFITVIGSSQENPNSSNIQTSLKVRALQEKKEEYHSRTNGESDDYRVKSILVRKKVKAKKLQQNFLLNTLMFLFK